MERETEQFPDGDVIFHEGDRATRAYIVISGTVVLKRGLAGGALTLDQVEVGEIFGEVGLLDPGPRTATAVAEGEVTLQPVGKSLFLEKVQKDPQRAFELLKTMARRLRTTDSLLTEAASRNGPPTSPKKPKKRGKRRFWPRLKRKNPPRPQICVAAISGAAGMEKQLVRALEMPPTADVRRISDSFPLSDLPGTLHDSDLAAQEKEIRARLKKEKAEAMLWGEMDATGRFLALRITRREAPSHPTLRFLDSLDVFYLPISPGEAHLALLKGLLITALSPGTLQKPPVQARLEALATQARDVGMSQRPGEAGSEQAATLSAYAGLLASLDCYASETGRLTQAEDLYAQAQKRLPAEADGQKALLSARMGMLRRLKAAREKSPQHYKAAVSCFDGALDALARERDPLFQGMVYEALGEVLYLLALYNGSGETLKESFNALQSALQVFSREVWPEAWADITAALARSLQVYGEQLRSEEAFERSIALCREALEIRTRRSAPLPWAGLRNNLASGLFLLGKARKDPDLLQEAADTFQDAVTVYRSRGYKGKADTAAKNLERAETLHEKLSREGPSAPDTDWSLALDGDSEN